MGNYTGTIVNPYRYIGDNSAKRCEFHKYHRHVSGIASMIRPSVVSILSLARLMRRSTMAFSNAATKIDGVATKNEIMFTVSPHIQQTLDPCVVLMKEMMQEYQSLWRDDDIGIVSLAQGVVYWEPPETSQKAIQEALWNPNTFQLHTYGPDEGLPDVREAFRQKIIQENQLLHHQVMITMGANQAYMNCVLALGGNERSCVVFTPYYFNHVMALQMTNTPIVYCECNDEGIPNLEQLERLFQSVPTIRMVTLTNPGNPTGVLLSREFVQSVVTLCQQYHAWLILDVTYEYFQHENSGNNKSNLQQDPKATVLDNLCFTDSHVIHIFSFSKSYSLAGYRCGCLVVHDESSLWPQLLKVQDTIPIGPARIGQVAALGALQSGQTWVLQRVKTLTESRHAIRQALTPLPHIMGGSGAMYVMAQLPHEPMDAENQALTKPCDDIALARNLVQDYGVAVIPGSFCGKPGWIRVCYANLSPEKCLVAAERLGRGLRELLHLG
jgi:aspartate/methionine/tyrosine aminotransferase